MNIEEILAHRMLVLALKGGMALQTQVRVLGDENGRVVGSVRRMAPDAEHAGVRRLFIPDLHVAVAFVAELVVLSVDEALILGGVRVVTRAAGQVDADRVMARLRELVLNRRVALVAELRLSLHQ